MTEINWDDEITGLRLWNLASSDLEMLPTVSSLLSLAVLSLLSLGTARAVSSTLVHNSMKMSLWCSSKWFLSNWGWGDNDIKYDFFQNITVILRSNKESLLFVQLASTKDYIIRKIQIFFVKPFNTAANGAKEER